VIVGRGTPFRMVLGKRKMIVGWEEHLLSFLKCFWNIHLSLLPLQLGESKDARSTILMLTTIGM
jgi:hypothetical protein